MIKVNTNCKYCLKEFKAKSIRAVFCSSKCRVYFRRETEYKSRNKPFTGAVTDDFKPVLAPIIEKQGKRTGKEVIGKAGDTAAPLVESVVKPVIRDNESKWDFRIRLQEWKDKNNIS